MSAYEESETAATSTLPRPRRSAKHHAGDDKQTAQRHDKHRKVELTER